MRESSVSSDTKVCPIGTRVDPDRPVRLISAVNRIFKAAGLNDLEQIEDAPEYRAGVKVTPEMVEEFLRAKSRATA